MHIAVIAANGRLGKAFVEEALKAGHSVRAGVRDGSDFPTHPNLEIMLCDATNKEEVTNLLQDQEVVVSGIGHVKGSNEDVQTVATRTLLEVMQALGIKRFVDVTGTGVRFPGDKISLVDRVLNLGVSTLDPARVKDGKDHVEVLKASSVDWTTVRVLKLQNVAPQPFTLTLNGPTKWYVGRHEVAQAILQVIQDHSFIQQAPIISHP